jgi:hypothetical protein
MLVRIGSLLFRRTQAECRALAGVPLSLSLSGSLLLVSSLQMCAVSGNWELGLVLDFLSLLVVHPSFLILELMSRKSNSITSIEWGAS